MPDPSRKKDVGVPQQDQIVPQQGRIVPQPDDEKLQDEEKILAGRDDVNYPALLTKDVPGG